MAAAAAILLTVGSVFGQTTTGTVTGQVTDGGHDDPIASATVTVVGTTLGGETDERGYYSIHDVPAGLHAIRVEKLGFRPAEVADERILAGRETRLNWRLDAEPASGSIVPGELVDRLPVDRAADVVVLQPGVVETITGPGLRGGQPGEEAVLIDGVLTRSFGTGTADNLRLPTNALEQMSVTVGAFPAQFGEAESGLVRYVTRAGGDRLSGSFEAMSDRMGPDAWRTNFDRIELTASGPIAGPVSFFLSGTAEGRDAAVTQNAPDRYVIDGLDTCDVENFCEAANGGPGLGAPAVFRLPRSSVTPDANDFVDVAAPTFVAWDNGRTAPFGWTEHDAWHASVRWRLPRGSRVNLSLTRNRDQAAGHPGFTTDFLFDGVDGALSTRNVYALSWMQTVRQTAKDQLQLDVLVAYSQDRDTGGMLDQVWWRDHADPSLSFLGGNPSFAYDDQRTVTGFDAFDPSEDFLDAYRSNAIPRDSLLVLPGRRDLARTSQSAAGLSQNLRANPYALSTDFPIQGAGNQGFARRAENRLELRGAMDWQIGRVHRVQAGIEYFSIALDDFSRPLADGLVVPESADPRKLGLFVQDGLTLDQLTVDAGLRYDHLDTDIEYPLVPGYVFNVPDSLKQSFVRYDAGTGGYVPLFDEPCGGVSPSNPTGACHGNFVAAEPKSEISPRVAASFAVSEHSAFRAGYGRYVQTPAFFTALPMPVNGAGLFTGTPGLMQNVNLDRVSVGSGFVFGRDVDLPVARKVELGYRMLIGEPLVLDVAVFDEQRDHTLVVVAQQYEDPNTGVPIFLNTLANGDATSAKGFQVSLDAAVGTLFDNRLAYTYIAPEDNSIFTQVRRHNLSWTGALTFPTDYRRSSIVGSILRDVGLFTTLRIRSGLPYTLLQNQGNGPIGPPSATGLPAGGINDASTPWTTAFDLRLTKGFHLGHGLDLQAFVDWRNPFDLENRSIVFLETGDVVNDLFRQGVLASALRDTQLDGSNDIDDVDIRAESPDSRFNQFMLLRAEQRFGNGDGVFTVEEQQAAFGQVYDNFYGADVRFRRSDQLMRLGVRLAF